MPTLAIPPPYRPGVKKLAALSKEAAKELEDALQSEQPVLEEGGLAGHVAANLATIKTEDTRAIVDALVALSSARDLLSLPASQIADGVATSNDLDLTPDEQARLRSVLPSLLDTPSVLVTGRALGVLTEQARIYREARIVTDIRPVFPNGPEKGAVAAGIVHSLRIAYQEKGRFEEFFIALYPEDVASLRLILDRADNKVAALKELIDKTGLIYLELKNKEK